uniref:Alpha/beta hydrolase fold containing protein n=1 Tax=uncultured bacterium TB157_p TaxID=1552133 RepID=A0A0K0LBH2_9BACT|nr:alpha/beta hydrolase fold containing protein [uncultured bacterium TB157_p]
MFFNTTRQQPTFIKETRDELCDNKRRRRNFLQRLGPQGCPADPLPSRLAAEQRRLGQSNALLLNKGFRVVAHDRRGHGRSEQVSDGHDMDHYAADASAVAEHLDLKNAVHIGHSTGGGQVARYVAQFGEPQGRVAKAVLVSSVPPLLLKTDDNPDGVPMEVFDGFRKDLADNRAQFFVEVPSGPFYGFNRKDAKPIQGVIDNWWRQGMTGSAKAHYEGIKAFSETDQTDDLKAMTVPTLVLHGDDDQMVPYKLGGVRQDELLQNSKLIIYPGFSHGMLTINADVVNADILEFIQS